VTIEYDVNSANNVNLQPLNPMNNPQAGGLAPEAFSDANLNTTFDPLAFSGYFHCMFSRLIDNSPLFSLQDGSLVC
jgi:hypothetical protein